MAIITLTTDFGLKDHFVGALKGSIYKELADAKIVDISHQIGAYNIQECAYLLKNAYEHFPEGSVHLIGVEAEPTPENEHIAVLLNGHYFVTANNGVIGLLNDVTTPEKVVKIDLPNTQKTVFPEKDIFVKVACHLARGGKLELIGKPFDNLKEIKGFAPTVVDNGNKIIGSVIYIDNYGNVVTNIQKNLFDAYRAGRSFEISARTTKFTKISNTYSDIINFDLEKNRRKGAGDLLAIFNSSNHIELAIYKSDLNTVGGASTLLGLDYRDTITVTFA